MAKYCTHCGNEVNEDAVICIHCGCEIPKSELNAQKASHSQQSPYTAIILEL